MAHSPIFRPAASSDPHASRSVPTAGKGHASLEPAGLSQLARWQSLLSAHGGGPVSIDLALDLVLNEIVEVTRESTHAQAAAIALARDGEIVCRATTGDGAPGLGVRLSGDTGLSAACVQTGNWQRCEDSESDPRVDAELCRRLEVRSILVVPVLQAGELLGLIEIFSGRPGAFGEREVRTLQMLSRSVVENIELARRSGEVEAAPDEVVGTGGEQAASGSADAGLIEAGSTESKEATDRLTGAEVAETADFWTGALMLAVVVLAVTLGWMVGRSGRHSPRAEVRPVSASLQTTADATKTEVSATPVKPAPAMPTSKAGTASELIVYQDGKMVFPKTPPVVEAQPRPATTATTLRPAVETSKIPATGPVRIAPEIATGLVTQRVEPEYPQSARERRVQGAVVLDALVGRDGMVEKFMSIRGDPELAAAASTAVRQWRFKPYQADGKEQAFLTQITVVFRLP